MKAEVRQSKAEADNMVRVAKAEAKVEKTKAKAAAAKAEAKAGAEKAAAADAALAEKTKADAAKAAKEAKAAEDAKAAAALSKLCEIMISYTQRNANAKALALNLYSELEKHGYKVWLDVKVDDKSEAAMQKAVNTSKFVIAILCDGQGQQGCAYFEREFCLKELRWAKQAKKFIQPVLMDEDKTRINVLLNGGAYPDTTRFEGAPKDLRDLGSVDMVDLNMTDPEYFELGLEKIIRKAKANGVEIDAFVRRAAAA